MAPSATEKATAKSHTGCEDHEVEGKENEWKFRAPYKIHENVSSSQSAPSKPTGDDTEMTSDSEDMQKSGKESEEQGGGDGEKGEGKEGGKKESGGFKAVYEGGCHCGKVKFQLSRDAPVKSKFCHCSTCQRLHGAPFQHAAIFHKEDINFLKGHHDLQWYDSQEKTTRHKLPCKVSCKYCGSWIMDEGRSMILLFPGLLELDEEARKKFKPTLHMFYANRMVDINDGLPKWAGMQNDSELIADTPAEDIKKRKREVEEKEREERSKKRHSDKDEEEGKDGKDDEKGKNDGKK